MIAAAIQLFLILFIAGDSERRVVWIDGDQVRWEWCYHEGQAWVGEWYGSGLVYGFGCQSVRTEE